MAKSDTCGLVRNGSNVRHRLFPKQHPTANSANSLLIAFASGEHPLWLVECNWHSSAENERNLTHESQGSIMAALVDIPAVGSPALTGLTAKLKVGARLKGRQSALPS